MKKAAFVLCIILVVSMQLCVMADGVDDMMAGKQDLVILGSVKDITGDFATVTVDHVLGRGASDLIGKDININKFSYTYCEEHSTSDFRNPIISDNIVISLNKDGEVYSIANSAYKVDSNEYANCRIVVLQSLHEEDCVKDMQEATCYIRANGMVNKFEFDSEGRIYAVYPQTVEQCVSVVDEAGESVASEETPDTLPTVPNAPMPNPEPIRADNRGKYAVVIVALGAILGMGVSYFIYSRKSK